MKTEIVLPEARIPHLVEASQLPRDAMVLFGNPDEAFAYAEKHGEIVYYVPSNASYYVVAHRGESKKQTWTDEEIEEILKREG